MKKIAFLFIAFFIAHFTIAQEQKKLSTHLITNELSFMHSRSEVDRWYENMQSNYPSYVENGLHRVLIRMKISTDYD